MLLIYNYSLLLNKNNYVINNVINNVIMLLIISL